MIDKEYHLIILQCVSGNWRELIRVGINGRISKEQATEHLSEFTQKLFDTGKMFITKQNASIILNTDRWPVSIQLGEGPCEE